MIKRLSQTGVVDFGWILASGVLIPYRSIAGEADSILRYGYGGRESGQRLALQWMAEATRNDPGKLLSIGEMRHNGRSDMTLTWGWLEFGLQYLYAAPNSTASDLSPQNDYPAVEFLGAGRNHRSTGYPWDGYDPVWESRRYSICVRRP